MAKKNTKGTLKKLFKYIGGYKWLLLFSLFLALICVVSTLAIPIYIGQATDCIIGKGEVDFTKLVSILIKIGIAMAVTGVSTYVMNIVNNRLTYNVSMDLRMDAFAHIQGVRLSVLDKYKTGELISRVISDVDNLSNGLLMGFTQGFTGIMTIIGTLIFMFMTNIVITLVVVLITPISIFVAKQIAQKSYKHFKLQSEMLGKETAFIDEHVTNVKILRQFGRADEAVESFKEINESLAGAQLKATFISSLTNPATRFVNSLVYAAVAVVGGFYAMSGGITVGTLAAFLSYASQYTKPFNEISGVVTEFQSALASCERIFGILEMPLREDSPEAVKNTVSGEVEIKDVSFRYVEDKPLIEDFNLNVKKGEKIAIVGPTGCGKTTFINLLMRFYDVNSGEICFDGVNIRDYDRKALRESIGMVLQETWICEASVADNIRFGKADASDEEVIAAAKAVHAHSFIKRLPQGYDTIISGDFAELSEGQKQLLCIARVMLKNPSMLILDEATSNIDIRTEQKVQDAFNKLCEGKTSFIVAHRLSTVMNADHILVMRDGSIVEQGNHKELLSKNGFYAEIFNSQFISA